MTLRARRRTSSDTSGLSPTADASPERRVAGAGAVAGRIVAGIVVHAGRVQGIDRRQALAALSLAAVIAVEQRRAGDDLAEVALRRRRSFGASAGVEGVGRAARHGARSAERPGDAGLHDRVRSGTRRRGRSAPTAPAAAEAVRGGARRPGGW